MIRAREIYDAYPDADLLPIDRPSKKIGVRDYLLTQGDDDFGDTLFLFLLREANDEIDREQYAGRLQRAKLDVEAVLQAIETGEMTG